MIFRGSRLSYLRLPCLAFRHGEPLPLYAERVSASFSIFLGRRRPGSRDHGNHITPISYRSYVDRPASRPKAHTGRTTTAPSKKIVTATRVTVKAKPILGEKSDPKVKAKPKTKPKTKPKPKAKAKRKARKTKRKVLTEEQKEKLAAKKAKRKDKLAAKKEKQKFKDLKAAALDPPSRGRLSVWQIIVSETSRKQVGAQTTTKEASTQYQALSPERREHYNRIKIQTNAALKAAFHEWLESYTPEQIRLANLARSRLRRDRIKGNRWAKIPDERMPKRFLGARLFYIKERFGSGEFAGISMTEMIKLSNKEWAALPAADKKKFEDMSSQDYQRWEQEMKALHNRDVPAQPPKAAAAVAAAA